MTHRRGFTLIEVLLALVIMGIVTGALFRLLNTSQRLSLAQAEQVSLQSNVRTGSLVVPNELRELNTVLGGAADRNDVTDADPDGITYRAMRGLGFVCEAPAATKLRLAQSSWTGLRAPDAGRDDLYLFIDGDPNEDDDDTWLQVSLTGAAFLANACGGAPGYELTAAAFPAVPVNTPVRVFELMRLELYAEDGQWWMGAQSVSAGEIEPQPMLGPLTDDGFGLEYLGSDGNPTADLTAIKSIRLTVRGLTDDAVRANGSGAMGHPEEELVTQVLLRNSIRP
ncbi:MAG TPA: prepilin-type N-terminal cleavage/methylation domain-containing protein [Gemmatimonadales bacterium]|nr:prepilin-type N-terminal cleavage/methylation domain-containing protein [Gemmatimonadales bacterium]